MHGRTAAGAVSVVRLDRDMNARQMSREGAAIGVAILGPLASARLILLVVLGFACRNGLLDVLERESELLGIELLRALAKLGTLQLPQQMPQPLILR